MMISCGVKRNEMRILITGGLGFIGSNLAHSLVKKGHEITLLTRSREKVLNIKDIERRVILIEKNMNQMSEIENIGDLIREHDVIFHLAGNMGNYSILGNPLQDIEDNCQSTLTLLELCRIHKPEIKIIYGSAFFVHGKVEQVPVKEEEPCNPVSLFGATRLAGEHFCHIYNNIYDMNVTIARFANVFGIRELMNDKKKAAFNYFIRLALEGKDIPMYGKGDILRDLIYVSDVVRALELLMEVGERNEIYFVGRGVGVSLREFLEMMIEETGSASIHSISPPEFHNRIGITNFICDISKLRSLGWEPEVDLGGGIRRTVEFYRRPENWEIYIEGAK